MTSQRSDRPYRILTVCTGNICRSPMAEYILREAVDGTDLSGRLEIASAGTTGWEAGNPMDPRARAVLEPRGIDTSSHRARAMTAQMLQDSDLILALDHDHVGPLRELAGEAADRVHLLREFDPAAGEDLGIRDPWYGTDADFDTTEELIEAAVPGILEHARRELAAAD